MGWKFEVKLKMGLILKFHLRRNCLVLSRMTQNLKFPISLTPGCSKLVSLNKKSCLLCQYFRKSNLSFMFTVLPATKQIWQFDVFPHSTCEIGSSKLPTRLLVNQSGQSERTLSCKNHKANVQDFPHEKWFQRNSSEEMKSVSKKAF